MGTIISDSPQLIYVEDVKFGAAVSEAVEFKKGATNNFVLNNFFQMTFGVVGNAYSGLSVYPYTFNETKERAVRPFQIMKINVSNDVSGIAGQTEFRIEKQLAGGGAWTNIFSTNCIISNTAADDISFNSDESAPSGVTLPVLSTTTLAISDRLRFVLVTAATSASNLVVNVILRPTA